MLRMQSCMAKVMNTTMTGLIKDDERLRQRIQELEKRLDWSYSESHLHKKKTNDILDIPHVGITSQERRFGAFQEMPHEFFSKSWLPH